MMVKEMYHSIRSTKQKMEPHHLSNQTAVSEPFYVNHFILKKLEIEPFRPTSLYNRREKVGHTKKQRQRTMVTV